MKQQFLTCLIAACTCYFSTQAQYNKTYEASIAGAALYSSPIDIVETGNGSTCVLSPASDGTKGLVLLRKVDNLGNIIFETMHDLGNTRHYFTKLLHTNNDEYIAVGFYVMPATHPNPAYNYAYQPFATKFDNAGNHVWTKVYQVSLTYWPSINSNYGRVNITKTPDEIDAETYILTYPADQDVYPLPPTGSPGPQVNADVTIGALKIDANGNVWWNYKYYIPQMSRPAGLYENRDYPNTLVYGNGKYFIAGTTIRHATTYHQDINFYMSIDNMGNIVDDYRTFTAPGYNFRHDAIFDQATNEFVMTYTLGAYYYPGSNSASEIAITKVDAGTFNINTTAYYYDADAIENYGFDIKETPAHDAYVLACRTDGSVTDPLMVITASLLKVDKNNTPILYKSYNVHRYQYARGLATYINPATGIENYAMCTSADDDTRMITADNNLSVCGEYDRPVTWGYENTVADPPVQYNRSFYCNTITLVGIPVGFTSNITDCDLSGTKTSEYRLATSVNNVDKNANAVVVYPTLLTSGDNRMNIELTADNNSQLNVTAISIDGRVVFNYKIQANKGSNKLVFEIPDLAPGNYVLKINSEDNIIQKTQRISKL